MSPLTGVLTEAWYLYRRFAGHFLLISFVIYLITGVLVALLSLAKTPGVIIGDVISFAATYVVQAALIKAVQDVRDGRVDLDLSQTVRAAGPFILPVIGASILAGIGITIGFILLIVPGLILLTYWCLIVPFIVLAGSGVFESFGNSMRTVRGYAWRVFGTYVLVFLILIAFAIVLGLHPDTPAAVAAQLREQPRVRHLDRAVPGPGGHAHQLPPDRRPRRPAVHPHRPSGCHGLGAPVPHDDPQPGGLRRAAAGGLHGARPRSTGPHGAGFDGAVSHAGFYGTRSDRAPACYPAGPRPRRATASEHS